MLTNQNQKRPIYGLDQLTLFMFFAAIKPVIYDI